MVANVHPKFRSRLRTINVAAVAKYQFIEKYGINAILRPFVEDLNKLSSSGVNVTVNGSTENYKGALLAFLADTLASHLLGGFKRSMSFAYRNCRTCMATSQTFREKFNSNDFQLRSTSMHLANCQRLTGPLKKHYSKVYGINEKSILLDVNHYSMWVTP